MTTQTQVGTCEWDMSSTWSTHRRECGKPAVKALKAWNGIQLRCKRHASIDARRTYSRGELVEITQEMIDAQAAMNVEREKAKAAERRRRDAEHAQAHAAHVARRAEEALIAYKVTRMDEQGDVDWDATRASRLAGGEAVIYGPSTPTWYVHEADREPRQGWNESSVKVARQAELPTTLEVRNSSRLDINQAKAFVEALQAAIEEATK